MVAKRAGKRARGVVPALSRDPYAVQSVLEKNDETNSSRTIAACGYGSLLKAWTTRLVPELLAQNAFFEAVAGVEQHPHRDRLVGQHLDPANVAHFVVIGHRRHGALVALEHFDHHEGSVGEQGATPAPRPE